MVIIKIDAVCVKYHIKWDVLCILCIIEEKW